MALSRVIKTGDGNTTQFVVDFALGYLDQSNVTCQVGEEVDGAGNPVYRSITFLSSTLMKISGPAPGVGVRVVFERTVEKEDTVIHFADGDILDEHNLDLSFKQILMAVHEVIDGRFGQFDNDIDMGTFRIKNLGVPVADTDSATKKYVDNRIATGVTSSASAASSASSASASASAAAGSAKAASDSAAAAASSASNAASSAAAVSTAETHANASAAASAISAETATSRAAAAAASASAAATSATNAHESETSAAGSATSASTSATNSANSATAAASSSSSAKTEATNAGNSATIAANSEAAAKVASDKAEKSKDSAYLWSSENEDSPVDDGVHTGYSAYHWSKKAEHAAGGGVLSWAGLTGEISLASVTAKLSLADYARTDLSNITKDNLRTKVGTGTMAYRNITVSSSAPSGGSDGDVWYKI